RERPPADSRYGESKRRVTAPLKPAGDHRNQRYVAARHADTDAQAIGEIGVPQAWDTSRQDDAATGGEGTSSDHRARAKEVGQVSGNWTKREVQGRGDREDRRSCFARGAELLRHRFEECAEAVCHPEQRKTGEKSSGNGKPRARRIDHVVEDDRAQIVPVTA